MKSGMLLRRIETMQAFASTKPLRIGLLVQLLLKFSMLGLSMLAPLLFFVLVDRVMIDGQLGLLGYVLGGYVVLYIAESIATALQTYTGNAFTNRLTFRLQRRVWLYYHRMPIGQLEKQDIGDMKTRIDSDIEAVNRFFKEYILQYAYSWLYLLGSGVMLFVFGWQLAIFGMLMVPVSFWMTRRLSKGAKRTAEQYREVYGRYEGWLQETIRGWREIKANGMERRSRLAFTEYWHSLSIAFFKRHMYWFGNRSFQAVKDFFITRMNLYFLGGLLIIYGDMSVAGLLVFMRYYEQFFTHLGAISDLDIRYTSDQPNIEKVRHALDQSQSAVTERRGSKAPWHGTIEYDRVSFRYEGNTYDSLHLVSFRIEPGVKLAFAGRSGSGKTTIVKLLLGFYTPTSGSIMIDGQPLAQLPPSQLHQRIGVVMQDQHVFNRSIMDNIRLARPTATDAEVWEAARLVGMDSFVERFPDGYGTLIGEKGVKLSGGQIQRLALARAVLSRAELIILDEATSQLDNESEKIIHDVIDRLSETRSIWMIAHRQSSIREAERIILMDDGVVIDDGTHEELLVRSPVYQRIFSTREQVAAGGMEERGTL